MLVIAAPEKVTVLESEQHKALHDYVAGTLVLRGHAPASARLGYWRVAVFMVLPGAWMLSTVLVFGI